jgi:hypothetical protein
MNSVARSQILVANFQSLQACLHVEELFNVGVVEK